ncbi:MAG: TetR/AcrR family transcriptional regulator [Hyphomicrobiaceae bacterium]|nr:TetR/AcrR family transcriptional regulator [Hyphomicrobiaceae bacterium]MCC0023214.1 TetR/AcrR family transcriptional regulator [Hyphomicrobiaceae bacterium]
MRENVEAGHNLEALDAAMALFWSKGAETAAYNDLVTATGLSRKALYANWPDKDSLVQATLQRYRDLVLEMVLAPLAKGGEAGLNAFWDALESASQGPGWCGCYLFRTASGPMRSAPYVEKIVAEYTDTLQRAIATEVRRAIAEGAVDGGLDPELAGLQSVAINSLISLLGASGGYAAPVKRLYAAARKSCGLSV